MQESKVALTFEGFINEAEEELKLRKKLTGVVVFCEKDAWLDFDAAISRFNAVRRRWKADTINTYQNDFSILRFRDSTSDKDQKQDDKHFFVKTSADERYISLLVFSFEGYHGFETFETLITKYARNAWLGWLGSVFLEGFDTVVKQMYTDNGIPQDGEIQEEYDVTWDTFNFTVEGQKPTSTFRKRTKNDFIWLRNHYKKVLYLQKVTYNVLLRNQLVFKISLSDRTKFTLERGNIIVFLSLLREILDKAQEERDLFTRTSSFKKHEEKVETMNEPVQIISVEIDKIEIMEVDVSNPSFSSWFKKLRTTFSAGYIKDHNLLSSVIHEGNPYFLANIIDLDNASRLFISATSKSIRISPASEQTEPSTMSKLFTILQSEVDPSIGTRKLNAA
jgi:hypothetical protein